MRRLPISNFNKNNLVERFRKNYQIQSPTVRVIENGENLGILKIDEARKLALQKEKDLIEINSNAVPPVCVIQDFEKLIYEQKKKEKKLSHKQHKVGHKEVRLTPGIGQHDIETKTKQIRSFLEDGKIVKLIVRYKKRQIVHVDEGRKVLEQIISSIEDIGRIDKNAKMEDKQMVLLVSPK